MKTGNGRANPVRFHLHPPCGCFENGFVLSINRLNRLQCRNRSYLWGEFGCFKGELHTNHLHISCCWVGFVNGKLLSRDKVVNLIYCECTGVLLLLSEKS